MPVNYLPPRDFLVQCFDYDPETGLFRWRERPQSHFPNTPIYVMWNTQNAGNPAFTSVDADGYNRAEVRFDDRRVRTRAHRVAWKITFDEEHEQIDHIDTCRTHNAIDNLRPATNQQNQYNRAGWAGRTLPKGVYVSEGRIRASVWAGGRSIKLGTFATPEAAHAAYCEVARKLHREFFNPGLLGISVPAA